MAEEVQANTGGGYDENLDVAGEYSPKSDFSKAEVVKSQVSKCCEIRSKEMKEGYFNFEMTGKKVYIPDSRKEWVSAVKALRNLLSPEISRDKDYEKAEKELKEKEKKSFEDWSIYPLVVINVEVKENKKLPKYIPNVDQLSPVQYLVSSGGEIHPRIDTVKGRFNSNFHNYWNDMVEIYDEMFSELNKLFDRCNYFKQTASY